MGLVLVSAKALVLDSAPGRRILKKHRRPWRTRRQKEELSQGRPSHSDGSLQTLSRLASWSLSTPQKTGYMHLAFGRRKGQRKWPVVFIFSLPIDRYNVSSFAEQFDEGAVYSASSDGR